MVQEKMVAEKAIQIGLPMTDQNRPSRPWDLLNKNIGRVSDEVAKERLDICKECKFFISLTQQCKKCGCLMQAKTKLPNSECPIHKWDAVDINNVSWKDSDGAKE